MSNKKSHSESEYVPSSTSSSSDTDSTKSVNDNKTNRYNLRKRNNGEDGTKKPNTDTKKSIDDNAYNKDDKTANKDTEKDDPVLDNDKQLNKVNYQDKLEREDNLDEKSLTTDTQKNSEASIDNEQFIDNKKYIYETPEINIKRTKDTMQYNTDSSDESKKRKYNILDYLAEKYDSTENEIKEETINDWLVGVPLSKRRKVKNIAEKVYDKICAVPKRSDILMSKLPIGEKCVLVEQLDILDNEGYGTQGYFARKKDINRRLASYERMKETESQLEEIEKQADELFDVHDNPLKMQILTSSVSKYNKAVLLEKLYQWDMLSSDDSNKAKLYEWITWGLKIADNVIPLSVTLTDGQMAVNRYLFNVKQFLDSKIYKMIHVKEKLLELLAMRVANPNAKSMALAICGPPGVGKCLHPDTQILLYFGGMKAVKDISRGDILIGDDNHPRIVMSTITGSDTMYKIIPEFSDSFICNSPHILTVHNEFTGLTLDIPLNEYMEKSEAWKTKHKLFYIPVEYQRQDTKNDPYMVGVLLGGSAETKDAVIKEYLSKRLDNLADYVAGSLALSSLNLNAVDGDEISHLLNHKYIPDEYLYNTREIRYKILRGFLDSKNKRQDKSQDKRPRSKSAERTPNSRDLPRIRATTPKPPRRNTTHNRNHSTKNDDTKCVKFADCEFNDGIENSSEYNISALTPHSSTDSSITSMPIEVPVRSSLRKRFNDSVKFNNSTNFHDSTNSVKINNFKSKIPVLVKHETVLSIKNKILKEQMKFLIRSLGFKCSVIADEITIYGDISRLQPMGTKVEMNFTIAPDFSTDYCGFTLDKNGRFLLASCIVTHNTQIIQAFSEAINQPFIKINMGGNTDPHHFLGHTYTYEGSSPGVIVKAMASMKTSDGIRTKCGTILFDEFDKLGQRSKVGDAFLHISDPVQQKDFQDQYMPEIKIDLSHVTFVYSMNDKRNIDFTLLNRLPVIDVNGYSSNDKHDILTNYVIPSALSNLGFNVSDIKFTFDAVSEIIRKTMTMDKNGIRKSSEVIQSVVKKINALRCSSCENGFEIFSYSIKDFKLPIVIDCSILNKLNVLPQEEGINLSMYM
jgi:ATP-dependent Lon protease